jgi:hypothetical protein
MRREKLRRVLALAICDLLVGHRKSIPNITRYVIPYLGLYRIPRDQVKPHDLVVALELVMDAQAQNPIPFMHSDTKVWAAKRREFFLNSDTIFPASTKV